MSYLRRLSESNSASVSVSVSVPADISCAMYLSSTRAKRPNVPHPPRPFLSPIGGVWSSLYCISDFTGTYVGLLLKWLGHLDVSDLLVSGYNMPRHYTWDFRIELGGSFTRPLPRRKPYMCFQTSFLGRELWGNRGRFGTLTARGSPQLFRDPRASAARSEEFLNPESDFSHVF